jgi:hypothetical protein
MKTQNQEVFFNQNEYEAELLEIKKEIDLYNKCIEALERITGSKEIKSIEYVKEFICALTGFPAIQQSAELLNVANEYNYLKDNLENIKSEKSEIDQNQLDELREKHTTRLTDELQKEYIILEKISKEYAKLSNFGFINSIRCTDWNVYTIDCNSLHQMKQMISR